MSFRLPDLLLKLRCETPRKLYILAWSLSDDEGIFTLDTTRFGVPLRTLKHWARWFVYKAHLWEIVDPGGGRGHKAIFRIKGKAKFLRKQQHNKLYKEAKDKENSKPPLQADTDTVSKKSTAKDRTASPWKQVVTKRRVWFFEGWSALEKDRYGWDRCAQAFRLGLQDLGFSNQCARKLTGVIMNGLEHKTVEECRRIYRDLGAWLIKQFGVIKKLVKQSLERLYSWLGWVLSRFLKGQVPEELKTKRQKLLEAQGRVRRHQGYGERCECIECERQRVVRKRAEADKLFGVQRDVEGHRTYANWQDWQAAQVREIQERHCWRASETVNG